ncbi:MAG: gas vesicle protein, partial [Nocardioidaceae bacterium]
AVLLRQPGGRAVTEVATRASDPLQPVALVDLLDRLLGAGVVISGDLTISLAGVDLVQVRLHALISSVRADMVPPP